MNSATQTKNYKAHY